MDLGAPIACATLSAAALNGLVVLVPWAMNSPMPPVLTMSSPKKGNAFFRRCTSSGVFDRIPCAGS